MCKYECVLVCLCVSVNVLLLKKQFKDLLLKSTERFSGGNQSFKKF